MRDRGISSSGIKAWVTSAFALGGAAALIWGLQSPDPTLQSSVAAKTMGGTVLVIALLMTVNYLYTLSLIGRAQRGEDVIGQWTVPPDSFVKFRDIEHARKTRKNNWRVPGKDMPEGLQVIFTRRSVVVGDTWFRLAAEGMTHFSFARIETDVVSSVEFSMRLTIAGAGALAQTARYKGHLRVPIADDATVEAARVVAYFRGLV
jgi:hypothetical protein